LIMLEGADPLSPAALRTADQLERQLVKIPGVKAHGLLDFFAAQTPQQKSAPVKRSVCARSQPARHCSDALDFWVITTWGSESSCV